MDRADVNACAKIGEGGDALNHCSRFMRDVYMVQRIAAAAWFQPSPELIMTTRSPRLMTTLAGPQVADRHQSALLPIFAIGKIAEVQSDEKSIFLLKQAAHFRQRIIESNLRDRYISCTQCPRNDRRAFSTRNASPSRCP